MIRNAAMVIALVIGSCGAFSQTVSTPVSDDVEKVSDAFAGSKVSYWRGSYSFTGITNGIQTPVSSSFTIQLIGGQWGFTEMSVNGTELPIDPAHPMWQLPPYLAGQVSGFQFYLQGYDQSDKPVRYGNFWADSLAPNDDIKVTIYLNYRIVTIPFNLTGDEKAAFMKIESDDREHRYSGYYDSNSGQFYVSYDPVNPPRNWLVVDTRYNSVVRSLPFGGGPSNPLANAGYGFALVNQDGIPEISMDSSANWSGYVQGLASDNTITRAGSSYAGKIIIAHVSRPTDYMMVLLNGMKSGAVVQIFGLNASTGLMDHIGDWPVQSGQSWLNIFNVTGYTDYKVVVIGQPVDPINGFSISLYDLPYQWNTGGGGGIKG